MRWIGAAGPGSAVELLRGARFSAGIASVPAVDLDALSAAVAAGTRSCGFR